MASYVLSVEQAEKITPENGAFVGVYIKEKVNEKGSYEVDATKPVVVMMSDSVPAEGDGNRIASFAYNGSDVSKLTTENNGNTINSIDDIKPMLVNNEALIKQLDAITPGSNDTTAVDDFMNAANDFIPAEKQQAVREFLEKHIKPLEQGGSKKHRKSRRRADKRSHKKVRKSMHRRRQ